MTKTTSITMNCVWLICGLFSLLPAVYGSQNAADTLNRTLAPIKSAQTVSVLRNHVYDLFYGADLSLDAKLELEQHTWHWFPWRRLDIVHDPDTGQFVEEQCVPQQSSIHDFPDDLLTQAQRRQGAVILHILGAIYFFTFIAIVCDNYFIPSVECICQSLNISTDVAAATFMATATTMPEFFTNTISTFLTDSDMGLGTIIGSMLFNMFGAAAITGLAAIHPLQLDWWPITRDCFLFAINISLLVAFAWDGRIYWYEAMVFLILYFGYFLVMFQNKPLMRFVKKYVDDKWNCCLNKKSYDIETHVDEPHKYESNGIFSIDGTLKENGLPVKVFKVSFTNGGIKGTVIVAPSANSSSEGFGESDPLASVWRFPTTAPWYIMFWFVFTWPIKLILNYTVPDPMRRRKLFPITFAMCIIWIGLNSYMIFWMLALIGYTFYIPESVMGLTFLAAGGCLPEAISCFIMARRGNSGMGVSNSLGANSLAILFSLGVPWFIRTMIDGGQYEGAFIKLTSYGIQFTILSLLFAVAVFYAVISLAGYEMRKLVGIVLLFVYAIFITFALLVEIDVLFPSGNIC